MLLLSKVFYFILSTDRIFRIRCLQSLSPSLHAFFHCSLFAYVPPLEMPFVRIITNTLRRTLRITIFLSPCVIVPVQSFLSCSPRVSACFSVFLGEAMCELKSLLIFSLLSFEKGRKQEKLSFFFALKSTFLGGSLEKQEAVLKRGTIRAFKENFTQCRQKFPT